MSLSEWDRDYLEHLIQRDQKEEEESHREAIADRGTGRDRYFWDLFRWPVQSEGKEYQVARVRCPDPNCGQMLQFGINEPWGPCDGFPHHAPGCEFFRTEQRQWVDDWADVRRDHHVVRRPTWPEGLLIGALTGDSTAAERLRVVVTDDGDGQLLRQVV